MNIRRIGAAAIVLAAVALIGGKAEASMICQVPTTVTLDILSSGCQAVLTSGPIYFNNLSTSTGDTVDVEIDSLTLSDWNMGTQIAVLASGIVNDLTAHTSNGFITYSNPVFFDALSNGSNSPAGFAPNQGPLTFGIDHFIVPLNYNGPNSGQLKLNYGESGSSNQSGLNNVQVTADNTTTPGSFTISGAFQLYLEMTLSYNPQSPQSSQWVTASNDYSGTLNGTGSILSLENTPEPAAISLAMGGGLVLIALYRGRRRSVAV